MNKEQLEYVIDILESGEEGYAVMCGGCGWLGFEEDLEIFEDEVSEEYKEEYGKEFIKGCPHCETDSELMDLSLEDCLKTLSDLKEEEFNELQEEMVILKRYKIK